MRCVPYHKCFLVLWKLYFKLIGFICNFIYFLLYVLQNFILKRGPEVRGPRKFKKPLSCLANRWWNNRSKCVKHLAGGVPVAAPWSSSSASCFVLNLDQGILPPFLGVHQDGHSQLYPQAFAWLVLVLLNARTVYWVPACAREGAGAV